MWLNILGIIEHGQKPNESKVNIQLWPCTTNTPSTYHYYVQQFSMLKYKSKRKRFNKKNRNISGQWPTAPSILHYNDFLHRLYFLQGGLDLVKIFSGDPESMHGVTLYKVGMMRSPISHSMVKMYSVKLDIIHRYCIWYYMSTF